MHRGALFMLFIAGLCGCGGSGGGGAPSPNPYWMRNEVAAAVQQTTDGGWVLTGHVVPTEAPDFADMFAMKVDATGVVTWARKFGGAGDDRGRSVQQTADGGYVAVGYSDSFGDGSDDAYIVKLDAAGDLEWQWTSGRAGDDRAHSVVQIAAIAPSQPYVTSTMVAGIAKTGDGADAIYILRVDPAGTVTSEGILDPGVHLSWRSWTWANEIVQTSDGGFAIAGEWTNNVGYHLWLLARLDTGGVPVWWKTDTAAGGEGAWGLRQLGDGGFILVETTKLVRTNAVGDVVWKYPYAPTGGSYQFRSIDRAPGGGFVVCGEAFPSGDATLLKTDDNGALQWAAQYGVVPQSGDFALDVQACVGGGYILAGWGGLFDHPSADILLIRTDASGGSATWYAVSDAIPLD